MRAQISPARPALAKRAAPRKRAPRPILSRGSKLARQITRVARAANAR